MNIYKFSKSEGFAALVAVILISSGVLALSLVSISSALMYSDSISKKEYRVQAKLNADSCMNYATLMASKDYFMNGTTTVSQFGCQIFTRNDYSGNVSMDVIVDFLGIKVHDLRSLKIDEWGRIILPVGQSHGVGSIQPIGTLRVRLPSGPPKIYP